MSKVIQEFFAFTLPSFVIGSKKLAPPSRPIGRETKNSYLVTHVFPRFKQFSCFALSPHWLFMILTFVLIGRWDKCGFGFSTLGENCSIGVEPLSQDLFGRILAFANLQLSVSVLAHVVLVRDSQ